jgi:hypothetical protein
VLQEKRAPLNHALEMRKMDHETQLKKMELGETDERKHAYANLASAAGGHSGKRGVMPPGGTA